MEQIQLENFIKRIKKNHTVSVLLKPTLLYLTIRQFKVFPWISQFILSMSATDTQSIDCDGMLV